MSDQKLKVTIANVSTSMFDDEAISISVPAKEGTMQILAKHEPFITTLAKGKIVVEDLEHNKQEFDVEKGILEVSENQATVLVS